MKLFFNAPSRKSLVLWAFLIKRKERKLQYQWYHNFRSYLVEVTGLEPAASCSQTLQEYLFPLISRRFRPFPLGNTSFPAILSPLLPCTPVVSVG